MEYKISELVAKTGVPKSTILYYIREGLLPEANKIKSNVHRYNDQHIELIRYIKYMQEEIGSSNEQIRFALQNQNQSLSTSATMLQPLMNTLSDIPTDAKHFTKDEFIEHYNVDATLLETLLDDGVVLPLHEDDYTDREASIIKLVIYFKEVGVDYSVLKAYVEHAKVLSELEYQMQAKLCSVRGEENFSTLWKIMFETLFNAKPYLFNRNTYQVLLHAVKSEVKQ
ncbi:MerR family transcriptional regulator [Sulfurovum sp. XGS-02]|uniref:MerR family transcriptional regulator n=1 Tax=Sulfurovum sp. XGS-02 TaxID=2925411 RepID=UPI00204A39DC|nr:MerR family transcriptional regulator [Sulfurovum sp. XGS-02]UPT76590.1 MerR family transcriptional regulator [Sulfurovum sp. XGS-02]